MHEVYHFFNQNLMAYGKNSNIIWFARVRVCARIYNKVS